MHSLDFASLVLIFQGVLPFSWTSPFLWSGYFGLASKSLCLSFGKWATFPAITMLLFMIKSHTGQYHSSVSNLVTILIKVCRSRSFPPIFTVKLNKRPLGGHEGREGEEEEQVGDLHELQQYL